MTYSGDHSSEVFRTVVDRLPIGVTISRLEDPDDPGSFRLIYSNDAASDVFHIPFKAFHGMTLRERFPGLMDTPVPELYMEALRTGKVQMISELHFGDENVPQGVYSTKVIPINDQEIAVFFENITQRKLLENTLKDAKEDLEQKIIKRTAEVHDRAELYRSICEASMDGVYKMDQHGCILYVNETYASFMGYEREELIGQNFSLIIAPSAMEEGTKSFAMLMQGHSVKGEIFVRHKDGAEFPVVYLAVPTLVAGSVIGFTGTMRPVTAGKKMKQRSLSLKATVL